MLKRLISLPFKFLFLILLTTTMVSKTEAQCTTANVNWDNLDYLERNTTTYSSYITSGMFSNMVQTQRFAIGTRRLIMSSNYPSAGVLGENNTHTGDGGSFGTGADVAYTGNGTITLTFDSAVANVQFSLYDIDNAQIVTVTAAEGITPRTVALTKPGGGNVTIVSNVGTGGGTNQAVTSNVATLNIAVTGPVTTITLVFTGTAGDFWISDIQACVYGTLPSNWHQGYNNRPFVGPTQNQPDYFLVTPDNKSVYMMDPTTGKCWWLFSETASAPYVNSLAYDPESRYLYYVLDGSGTPSNNKAIKRYDFNTEAAPTTIVSDITGSLLNIPTFDQGVESAGAAFYNGQLYFGIEGGRSGSGSSTVTRQTLIYAIRFDASDNPTDAYQVFATDAYRNGTDSTLHDWADFIIKDGTIFDYNTARAGSSPIRYKYSGYHHYNMMTGNLVNYLNPVINNTYTGQSGMNWKGELFFVRDSVGRYFEDGTNALPANRYRAVVQSVPGDPAPPAWVGGAGDASDPFRPKCDFGDAPASYDPYINPATQSPAVHERSELIRLGATWDREFYKRGVTANNDVDDGISYTPIMAPGGGGYVVPVSAFNNSGSAATMIAWLDINGNGTFESGEAITPITVNSSASAQSFYLYWPNTTNTFINGQSTYLRVRITAASAGMTTAHPTGYFTNGEVEDYRVLIDNFPLQTSLLNFNVTLENKKAKLYWTMSEETGLYGYEIERTTDNNTWTKIGHINSGGAAGTRSYHYEDTNLQPGTYFYRIRIIEVTGMNRTTAIRKVEVKSFDDRITVSPNPARKTATIRLDAAAAGEVSLTITATQGNIILTKKQQVSAGVNNINLEFPASMAPGTYYILIASGDDISKKKIIKTK